MSETVKQAIDYCKKNSQEHLVDYLKPIFSSKSHGLAKQIIKTDLSEINLLYRDMVKDESNMVQNKNTNIVQGKSTNIVQSKSTDMVKDESLDMQGENTSLDLQNPVISPMKSLDIANLSKVQKDEFRKIGLDAICKGEIAAVTMAGGQGTRLGHDGPKGTFILPLAHPKSLFEIQCERLLVLKSQTGTTIPWLIMTSEENNKATQEYFKENNYFGYEKDKVMFFLQDMIPILDLNGKIIINQDGIAKSPNGNGGIFSSLIKSGLYDKLTQSGIKRVFVCGIDNALVKMVDPVFVGFSIISGKQIACKSTLKRSFDEKAGVFCYINGNPSYIEYTEISMERAKAVDDQGEYLYGDIGIVMYMFHMDILAKIATTPLPYHIAKKKTDYVSETGENIEPVKPNSIKFESFIFDSFRMVDDIALLRVLRDEEFAPIKNKYGEDSPESALELYEAQSKSNK